MVSWAANRLPKVMRQLFEKEQRNHIYRNYCKDYVSAQTKKAQHSLKKLAEELCK